MSMTEREIAAYLDEMRECLSDLEEAGETLSIGVGVCEACAEIHWFVKLRDHVLLELRLPVDSCINLDADLRTCITKKIALSPIMGSA